MIRSFITHIQWPHEPSEDLQAALHAATALPVERTAARRLLERRYRFRLLLLGEGIATGTGQPAVGEGFVPRLGQRHQGIAALTQRAGLAADDQSLHPTPGAGGIDAQVQAMSVAIETRPGGPDELGREAVGLVSSPRFGA